MHNEFQGQRPTREIFTQFPLSERSKGILIDLWTEEVKTVINSDALRINLQLKANQALADGTLTSSDSSLITTQLDRATHSLWQTLDSIKEVPEDERVSVSVPEIRKRVITQEKKSEKLEPLSTNNLEEDTREATALVIEYVRENSGFLEAGHPTVQALQNYLDKMRDPHAPPTRVLVAVDDKESNAFVLPDGTIIVTQALINEMDYIEEIVAVLAHEQVHFEKEHHKKDIKDWYQTDNTAELIQNFVLNTGLQRLHEYQADLALISKLDSLGMDTMAFESAIRKLGRTMKTEHGKEEPEGISLIHGTNTDRALNTVHAHAIVDFASSSAGEGMRQLIPKEWKRAVEDTLVERLQRMRPDTKWLELLDSAGPVLMRSYTKHLVDFCSGSHRSFLAKENQNLKIRRNFQKLEAVVKLFETRLEASDLSPPEKRRALILGLTQGANSEFYSWLRMRDEKVWSTPFDSFRRHTDLIRQLSASDFTTEGVASFIDLHKNQEIYILLGLHPPKKSYPSLLMGEEIRGYAHSELPGYFIRSVQIGLESVGFHGQEISYDKLLTHLHSVALIVGEKYDAETANKWFTNEVNALVYHFIDSRRRFTDFGKKALIRDTTELLSYITTRYSIHFSSNSLSSFAEMVGWGTFGPDEKVIREALALFIDKVRTIDPTFQRVFRDRNREELAVLLKNSPEEFQLQLANLRARSKLSTDDIEFLSGVIKDNLEQLSLPGSIVLRKDAEAELAKLGKSYDLSQLSADVLTQYGRVKFYLENIAILTAGMPLDVRIREYKKYLETPDLSKYIRSLPIVLLDDLCREMIYEGSQNQSGYGLQRQGISWSLEGKYDLARPQYEYKIDKYSNVLTHEGLLEIADKITSIPIFDILRDKLIAEVESSPTTPQVTSRYDYYINLLRTVYPAYGSPFWGASLSMADRISPFTTQLLEIFNHFSLDSARSEKVVSYYRFLREHLPVDYDNLQILSTLSERIILTLPFDDALNFLEIEVQENRFDFRAVNRFIEMRVNTKKDYDKCKATIARAVDDLMAHPRKVTGALAIADQALEFVSRDIDMASLMEKMILRGKDDSTLRAELAPLYWGSLVHDNITGLERERGYRVIPKNGKAEVVGPTAHTFHTFNEVLDRLYSLSDLQKMMLLRKVFFAWGNISPTKISRPRSRDDRFKT